MNEYRDFPSIPSELIRPMQRWYDEVRRQAVADIKRIDEESLAKKREEGYKDGLYDARHKLQIPYLYGVILLTLGVIIGHFL